jgi:hypothetical protein
MFAFASFRSPTDFSRYYQPLLTAFLGPQYKQIGITVLPHGAFANIIVRAMFRPSQTPGLGIEPS